MLVLTAKSVDLEICLTRSNTEMWSKYSVKFVQSLFFSTCQQQTQLNCPFGDETHRALGVRMYVHEEIQLIISCVYWKRS